MRGRKPNRPHHARAYQRHTLTTLVHLSRLSAGSSYPSRREATSNTRIASTTAAALNEDDRTNPPTGNRTPVDCVEKAIRSRGVWPSTSR